MATTLRQRIKDSIVQHIQHFAPHRRLPSELELAAQYDTSPDTVRRAIDELSDEGILYRIPHKGVFVSGAAGHTAPDVSKAKVEVVCLIGHRRFVSPGDASHPCLLCGTNVKPSGRFQNPDLTVLPSELVRGAHAPQYQLSLPEGTVYSI